MCTTAHPTTRARWVVRRACVRAHRRQLHRANSRLTTTPATTTDSERHGSQQHAAGVRRRVDPPVLGGRVSLFTRCMLERLVEFPSMILMQPNTNPTSFHGGAHDHDDSTDRGECTTTLAGPSTATTRCTARCEACSRSRTKRP